MNYFNQFENFNNLPPELQSVILSEYTDVLSKSPTINTKMLKITQDSYLNKICNQPISKKEIELYYNKYKPDYIYYFFQEKYRLIHMGVIKLSLQEIDDVMYTSSYEIIEEEENNLTYYIVSGENTDSIILNKENSEFLINIELDLLTQYTIYRYRHCDELKIHFARNLILNHLKNKYNELYKLNYKYLLMLYVYLKVNLLNFPIKIPNQFAGYEVAIDADGNIITINSDITPEELLYLIKNTVDDLYSKLVKFINMID